MSAHTVEKKTGQQVICERIAERIADLLEPETTRQTQWVMAEDGSKLEPRAHVIEHPPLLVQLEQAASGSTAGVSSSGYGSRPAGNIDAISALGYTRRHVAEWVRDDLHREPMPLVAGLQALASEAHTFDRDTLRRLDEDVRTWWVRARILTTWDTAPLKPFVPCMVCGVRGELRVRTDPTAAVCLACGSTWDASTIGILGEHIRIAMSDPIPDPPAPTSDEPA